MSRVESWKSVAGFVGLVGLGFLVAAPGCNSREAPQPPAETPGPLKELTVLTPHNQTICNAFAAGFSSWHMTNRKAPAHIKWVRRGTPQCVEYVRAILEKQAQGAAYEHPDVMFGGGIADHGALAAGGFSLAVNLGDAMAGFPEQVHGLPTRDAGGRWLATGLSSFGIVYKERACRQRGIAPPTTWEDLADPRFYGWVGLADPLASGSNRECMVLILQQQGWADGWGTIMRILANARALGDRSGEVLEQVNSGVSLAAFAVNFDGMALAAESGGALKYVDPPGGTAATPDIISVLSTARDPELARDFVRYVLSEQGQALWSFAEEHREPRGKALYHYPIDPAVYEHHADKLSVSQNPLTTDFGVRLDSEKAVQQGAALKLLVRAACGSNHLQLQQAWKAVIDAGMPAEALAELTAPPMDEQAAYQLGEQYERANPAAAQKLRMEWSAKFAERYRQITATVNP